MAQQPIRARAYCAHLNIHDHSALRCMSRCTDQVDSLKRDSQCLSPQIILRTLNLSKLKHPPVGVVWKLGVEVASSGVDLVT
ncbi:hypothetical protein TNCV_3498881 [Trichonephila clavipes]|nr:hypothetical protein TNCV_3498881 [Trichonephila clavipes]